MDHVWHPSSWEAANNHVIYPKPINTWYYAVVCHVIKGEQFNQLYFYELHGFSWYFRVCQSENLYLYWILLCSHHLSLWTLTLIMNFHSCQMPESNGDVLNGSQPQQLELAFEYLVAKDTLKWITIHSDQVGFASAAASLSSLPINLVYFYFAPFRPSSWVCVYKAWWMSSSWRKTGRNSNGCVSSVSS